MTSSLIVLADFVDRACGSKLRQRAVAHNDLNLVGNMLYVYAGFAGELGTSGVYPSLSVLEVKGRSSYGRISLKSVFANYISWEQ